MFSKGAYPNLPWFGKYCIIKGVNQYPMDYINYQEVEAGHVQPTNSFRFNSIL
jgi:hypothetical protein